MSSRRFVAKAERLLVIPDAHAHNSYSNERFDWLGALIAEERPDVIVCLGDFADMPSLSAYDKGKRGFEGRRYKLDVEVTHDALERMDAPIAKLNRELRAAHRVKYSPLRIMTLGNHEARISRATNDHSELDGTISIDDLRYREHGWEIVGYEDSANVCGFEISHHFASGIAGRPIGGMNAAQAMTRLLHSSAIVGHSHVKDIAERTRPDGSKIVCMSAGCYSADDQIEGWNRATERLWWRGVVIMDDVANGYYGALRWVTMERMRKVYGRTKRKAA